MIGGINLDSSTFMRLLVTELQHQNPMEPMSNQEMMGHLSQLAAVEGIHRLDSSFSDVLALQRMASGSALLGTTVEYRQDGLTRAGTVQAASMENGRLTLQVNGEHVDSRNVVRLV